MRPTAFRYFCSKPIRSRVVMESTPNPLAVMYTSEAFKGGGSGSGGRRSTTYTATSEFCPRAAKELLAVDGVEKVMIGEGFLSIVAPRMVSESEAFSKGQLEAFQRILENAEGLQEDFLGTSELDQAKDLPEQSEVEKRIQALLDDRIRPVIAQDGGDCEFVAFDSETGKVTLALHGSCEGCPQSAKTLKDSIERTLKFYIKEVTSVEPQQAAEARSPFVHHTHEGARMSDEEKEKLAAETPLFSTFAGATINERMVSRIHYRSQVDLSQQQAEDPETQVIINCKECGTHRNVEHVDNLLVNGPKSCGRAALVICPSCVTVIKIKP